MDEYWKRIPGHAKVKFVESPSRGNAGSSDYQVQPPMKHPPGTKVIWKPSPAARSAEYRMRRRAFIVHRPLEVQGLADVVAHLVDEDGNVLYSHVCSHPHYAFHDLWGGRPTRQHDHPSLMVDPHAYTLEELGERYPSIAVLASAAVTKRTAIE